VDRGVESLLDVREGDRERKKRPRRPPRVFEALLATRERLLLLPSCSSRGLMSTSLPPLAAQGSSFIDCAIRRAAREASAAASGLTRISRNE
jgi:hypothetical protein